MEDLQNGKTSLISLDSHSRNPHQQEEVKSQTTGDQELVKITADNAGGRDNAFTE